MHRFEVVHGFAFFAAKRLWHPTTKMFTETSFRFIRHSLMPTHSAKTWNEQGIGEFPVRPQTNFLPQLTNVAEPVARPLFGSQSAACCSGVTGAWPFMPRPRHAPRHRSAETTRDSPSRQRREHGAQRSCIRAMSDIG